jgi:hypothetical protein
MDRKYDGHSWCKVKMTNIKNNFNLTFHMTSYLGHLECWNHLYNYLVLNGNPNEIAWISNIVHSLSKYVLHEVHPFAKFATSCCFVLIHVQLTCIMSCIGRLIWIEQRFTLEPMIIMLPRASVKMSWNKSKPWSRKKVFFFKMCIDGDKSKFDLVKQMQPNVDPQTTWIMFDHVKRVQDWTTLAYHV